MAFLAYFFLGVYFVALGYISFYCLMQFHLLYHYQKHQKKLRKEGREPDPSDDFYPMVTIQLPIYNELYVVDRLIDNISKFDYPRDRFEVQVLDDSTDETVEIVAKKVAEYKAKGLDIIQVRRKDRVGYKAGALKEGMKTCKGEFIAIFDADFLPDPKFLKATVKYFQNPKIGVVQTKWEHLNQDYSLLTKLQALQLNVHFSVEQTGRKAGDLMLQFNGTGGIWRKQTIEDAGGWEADTLTEDLDLSYRAQIKGWEIMYLEDFGSPAELPSEMNGLKSQQFRWTKGGAETSKKMFRTIIKADIPFKRKFHALTHLMSSGVFVFILVSGIISVPLLFLLDGIEFNKNYLALFLASLFSLTAVFWVGNIDTKNGTQAKIRSLLKFLVIFPVFLSLSMGLSLHNSIAVIQGYLGKKSPFIRTPKFAIKNISDSFKREKYQARKINISTIFEGLLCLYFSAGMIGAFYLMDFTFILFHGLLAIGFGTIFYFSVAHLNKSH